MRKLLFALRSRLLLTGFLLALAICAIPATAQADAAHDAGTWGGLSNSY